MILTSERSKGVREMIDLENVLLLLRQSLEERLLDCYIESCEGAPKDKVRDAVLIQLLS